MCSCMVCAAAMIGRYPVQRQRFPASASSISWRVGFCLARYSAYSDITNPGVQKPHCEPWFSTMARWTGCRPPSSPRNPSTVISSLPSIVGKNCMHELMVLSATPSPSRPTSATTTVQAPQSPSAQPSLVPVRRRSSRRNCSTVRVGSTTCVSTTSPFNTKRIVLPDMLVNCPGMSNMTRVRPAGARDSPRRSERKTE